MSPLQMSILIHYIGHARDFRDGDFSAPAVRAAIDYFLGPAEMLELEPGTTDRCYRLSERGRVFTDAVLATPWPVRIWQMPTQLSTGEKT